MDNTHALDKTVRRDQRPGSTLFDQSGYDEKAGSTVKRGKRGVHLEDGTIASEGSDTLNDMKLLNKIQKAGTKEN